MELALEQFLNNVCEVRSMQNGLLAVGVITGMGEDGIVLQPARGQKMPLLRYRTQVKVTMKPQQGDELTMLVGCVYTSTDEQLRVAELMTLEYYERRNFFRVNVKVPVLLVQKPHKEETQQPEKCRTLHGKLLDISLGGCLLETSAVLALNQAFLASFILDEVTHEVELYICRMVEKKPDSPGQKNRYGCAFRNTSERKLDAICKDLFTLQRRIIQSRRG